ncbi:MAG: deoxyribonuclease IV [Bacilli bacterium]|nr:deoxyribonuclease IV [Bacilli bacterium]
MKEIIIGSHVNMSGSELLVGSVKSALSFGANTFMFYTGAPQNTLRKPVEELRVEEAKKLMEENNIDVKNLVVHAPYIINLGNLKDEEIFKLAKRVLKDEISRTNYIGVKYLVLHPGAHLNFGVEAGLNRIVEGLNEVLDSDDSDVTILLETMSGKGSELGKTFEELKYIIDHTNKKERLGVCLDTCHVFDGGYDIVNDLDGVLKSFDEIIGLELLKVIHVNDSKNVFGSHKDRHANIGEGNIGYDTLAKVVWHPLLENKIKILETPYIDDKPPYKEEIARLREYNK